MSGEERREARRLRRAERRDARQLRSSERQASRLARQEGRQGFLSNMVGEGGIGGLMDSAGDLFGGDTSSTSSGGGNTAGSSNKEGGEDFDIMKFLPLIAIGAFFLLKKK